MKKFPKEVEDFGNEFVQAQFKRHQADYDPSAVFTKSDVLNDIDAAELAIRNFLAVTPRDRRAFAAWVTLTIRKD